MPFALTFSCQHGCHSAGEPPWNDFDTSRLHLGLLISKLAEKNSNHLAPDSSSNCLVAKAFLLQLTQDNFNWSCLVSEPVQQWKIPKMFLFASAHSLEAPREAVWLAKALESHQHSGWAVLARVAVHGARPLLPQIFWETNIVREHLQGMPLFASESALPCARKQHMKFSVCIPTEEYPQCNMLHLSTDSWHIALVILLYNIILKNKWLSLTMALPRILAALLHLLKVVCLCTKSQFVWVPASMQLIFEVVVAETLQAGVTGAQDFWILDPQRT